MKKMSEDEFDKLIEGAELSDQQKAVLRADVGLPQTGGAPSLPEPGPYYRRLQMLAWAALKPAKKSP